MNFFFSTLLGSYERRVVSIFKEFHENGLLVGEIRASFFTLIPKKEGAISIRDVRLLVLLVAFIRF